MSTILKALRRLEQDKARERARSLEESVAEAQVRFRGRDAGLRLSLVLVCVVIGTAGGGLIAWFWLPRDQGGAPSGVAAIEPAVAAPAPLEPEPLSMPEPIVEPVVAPDPPATRDPPPVAVLRRPVSGEGKRDQEEPAAPVRTESEKRVLAERAEREAAPVVVRPAVPELIVRRTVWHPESKRRSAEVEVSGHAEPIRLGEGDSIQSLTVLEITPSGVSFEHGGVELYKRVGQR